MHFYHSLCLRIGLGFKSSDTILFYIRIRIRNKQRRLRRMRIRRRGFTGHNPGPFDLRHKSQMPNTTTVPPLSSATPLRPIPKPISFLSRSGPSGDLRKAGLLSSNSRTPEIFRIEIIRATVLINAEFIPMCTDVRTEHPDQPIRPRRMSLVGPIKIGL